MARLIDHHGKRWAARLGALALGTGLTGCAGPTVWDDVTSRDFKFKSVFTASPDPLAVLRDNPDGDARAKALASIKEPRANGGGDAQQDEVVGLLTRTAVGDPQPLCRGAAIRSLGRFRDPRAVPALIQAYDTAGQLQSDVAAAVQSQALTALGETHQPSAVNFLVQVASKPASAEATDRDRQVVRDNRLAAVRALKNFDGSPDAAAVAARLAETERDVALRDRARETYAKVSGKELPASPPNGQPELAAPQPANRDIQLTGNPTPP